MNGIYNKTCSEGIMHTPTCTHMHTQTHKDADPKAQNKNIFVYYIQCIQLYQRAL